MWRRLWDRVRNRLQLYDRLCVTLRRNLGFFGAAPVPLRRSTDGGGGAGILSSLKSLDEFRHIKSAISSAIVLKPGWPMAGCHPSLCVWTAHSVMRIGAEPDRPNIPDFRSDQWMCKPPFTSSVAPVTKPDRSDARKRQAPAISRAVPKRRSGMVSRMASSSVLDR
jgi:hypothetical protein